MNKSIYYGFVTSDFSEEIFTQLRFYRRTAIIACASVVLLARIVGNQRREIKLARLKKENYR